MQRDRHTCGYCGAAATELDHVFPWSRGGLTWADNLVAACFDCNHEKGDRTPDEWRTAKALAHYGGLVTKRRAHGLPLKKPFGRGRLHPTAAAYPYLATLKRR